MSHSLNVPIVLTRLIYTSPCTKNDLFVRLVSFYHRLVHSICFQGGLLRQFDYDVKTALESIKYSLR